MAELVVGPIVENVISTIGSLIKEEVGLLQGLKTEAQKLSSNLTSIQATLKDAEDRQLEDRPLRDWLAKLENVLFDAEDILDTLATEAALSKAKQKVRNTPYQLGAANKIKKTLARLDEITEEKEKFHLEIDSGDGSCQEQSQAFVFLDTADVCGRESDKERLRELLLSDKDDEMCVIPIIGMAGLGKTTLAQLIFNDDRVKERFERRWWVSVSANFNLTRIIRDIIEYHSNMKYPTDFSLSQLESRLLNILDGNPFLLVLDDVWNEDYMKWEPLRKILQRGDKRTKIIVTSRSEEVARIMGTRPPYCLEFLPEDQCWSLFEKIAFNHSNDSERLHLEDIGRKIVSKCKGLPLAVKAMAGLLRGDGNVNKWQNILSSPVWELEEGDYHTNTPNILPLLKISYNHLPPYLKQCFAYCSIFPKAYVFHKEELVKIWMAQGFVHSRGQLEKEETGNRYCDELVTRSFFQRSDAEKGKVRYQMHDLIHDLAQSISSSHCCLLKDNDSCTTSQDCRHVSLLCEDIEPSVLSIAENSKSLRTLLFPNDYLKNFGVQALEKLFHTLKYLRMLDLSNSTLSVLPSSIEELKLLRYLDLSRTEIKVLPNSICNLYNLQTLKLLGCHWFFKLPEDLGKLVNLRNLELDDIFWFKSSTLPPRIGNLTSLRNLHAFQVGRKSGYGIDELKNLAYLTGKLHISKLENAANAGDAKLNGKKSLDELVLEWSGRDVDSQDVSLEEKLLQDLQPHSSLTVLHIFNYKGNNFPNWITGGLLQDLHTLTLNGCTGCRILSLAQIPRLRILNIKRMPELEKWSDERCTSLCRLKISCCEKLFELPQFLFNIGVMKIKRCHSLKSLPVTPSLQFLILNDNPVLEDLNERILRRITQSNQDHGVTVHQPSFLNLLEMKIINCPKVQALPKWFTPQKMEISGCELMTALTIPDLSRRLQHLALNECHDGTLVRAIPNTSSLYSLVISNISNLISFTRWPNLPGLKALYIRHCQDLVSLSGEGSLISFSSLQLLSIRGCPKLESLPNEGLPTELKCLIIVSCTSLKSLGTKGTLKSLNSLKDLHIEDCPLLLSFPEDGLPTSLQHLRIQGCPSLTQQCGTEEGPEWTKISHIPDRETDFITSQHPSKKKAHSAARFLPFVCSGGFDISGTDAQSSSTGPKGFKWKGKME
ncbi:hypothetical protein Ddye_026233 [Dipteronia dyeriana]|uniref:Disease resistance protein RGA3 n=1 Tax=Dipteronia dyeriana TaxID=168575 RepID=A0AAD9TMM1_9ROSI|nr:hypothetical protein Ddye_026233 [Dipteronia dyeriana]